MRVEGPAQRDGRMLPHRSLPWRGRDARRRIDDSPRRHSARDSEHRRTLVSCDSTTAAGDAGPTESMEQAHRFWGSEGAVKGRVPHAMMCPNRAPRPVRGSVPSHSLREVAESHHPDETEALRHDPSPSAVGLDIGVLGDDARGVEVVAEVPHGHLRHVNIWPNLRIGPLGPPLGPPTGRPTTKRPTKTTNRGGS